MYFPGVLVSCFEFRARSRLVSATWLSVREQVKSSGKVFYCHYKPADPCHADALCASNHTSSRT